MAEHANVRAVELTDVHYEVSGSVAVITIDRPERRNAFRAQTVRELTEAFRAARAAREVGAVVLTGSGDKAFCAGGDVKERAESSGTDSAAIQDLHRLIRDIPKPVIAAVNGAAIGGGHVLHVLCDLTVAAEHATFGQTGPRVGSFDAGFGTAYLARIVGEKRARQIWFLVEQFDAQTAERWGLVNAVVPAGELMATALAWGERMSGLSPTALRFLKHSFNADTEHLAGVSHVAFGALDLFSHTAEAAEGANAFTAKRPPDYSPFR